MDNVYLACFVCHDVGEHVVAAFGSEKKAKDYVYNRLWDCFNGGLDADDEGVMSIEINDEVGDSCDDTNNVVATFEVAGDVEALVRVVEYIEKLDLR